MKGLRKKLVFSLLTVLSVLDLFLLQILKFSVSPVLQASCLSSNYCYILHYLYYYINVFLHMIIRINFSVWLITRHKTPVKLALIIQLIEYHPICSYKNNICLRKYFWKQLLYPLFITLFTEMKKLLLHEWVTFLQPFPGICFCHCYYMK